MKKLTQLLVIVSFAFSNIHTQDIPHKINYQGILKDAAGVIVPNGDYNLTFRLYDIESGGAELWTETKTVNVVGGIINTPLGSITPISSELFLQAIWLGITISSGSELTPRITLSSVPYSFMSMNVPDGSITATKISDAEVVKSLNGLRDNINLIAGTNVTITPSGNDLTITAAGGSGGTIGGSGTANYVPLFTNSTTLDNSQIFQDASGNLGIGTVTPYGKLDVYGDIVLSAGSTTSSTTIGLKNKICPTDWWGLTLNIFENEYYSFDRLGTAYFSERLGIGTTHPLYPLHVATHRRTAGYFTTDSLSDDAHALQGEFLGTGLHDGVGVYGKSVPADYYGYGGYFHGGFVGVRGEVRPTGSSKYSGVQGLVFNNGTGYNYGVYGEASGGTGTNIGIYGEASGGTSTWAGYFQGNVNVTGTLSKGGGSFKIDHPLDPTNKYLYHSFVESPDMMNIYNGNIITDGTGYATITMPNWFEALNQDFRYQLTVIGDFAQAIISQEIQNNQFIIRTDKPNVKVSWQVTGIRHDKFAEKNRIPVEENKTGKEVGKYLHPEAYGVSESLGVNYENKKAVDKK